MLLLEWYGTKCRRFKAHINQPKSRLPRRRAMPGSVRGQGCAFYVLALPSGGEPRGLPGATVRNVAFQQRVAEHPLDDVVIKTVNRDGSGRSPSTGTSWLLRL